MIHRAKTKTEGEKLEVPVVRVKHYNSETGDIEMGRVIDSTRNTHLVIPDYDLSITVRWSKHDCDIL